MNREIEISPYGSLLVYKKGYTVDFVRSLLDKKKLRGLRIFAMLNEDRLPDLDFLSDYSFLEVLDITSVDDYNYNFLYSLKNIKELSINIEGRNIIDLSYQENILDLTIKWRKGKILGLEKCQKISSLCLIEYTEENFYPISPLQNLKNLIVKTGSIKSVNGVERLLVLENLLLGYCKLLKSINSLERNFNLKSISFERCSNIEDYTPLGHLSNLDILQIIDCKGINSIRFVQNLSALKKLMLLGNTVVLDGDLMPAKGIKEVIHVHHKHYNIKIENKENDRLMKSNLDRIKTKYK
jgi:hypothetical protein